MILNRKVFSLEYYPWHDECPHDVGLTGYQDNASTYDTWIMTGFCVPGYMGKGGCGSPGVCKYDTGK